ncbi:Protein ytfJ precursor [hydrothermal vent metagenome]|uniref:Protein ytfJ n=1 Tax=hydrothermal vent metagenome TaxID=652676 RepID=A0A1W1E6N7_9ZZZZ
MQKLLKTGVLLGCMAAALFAVEVGTVLPHAVLEGKNGGRSDGKAWDSGQLQGKVHVLMYMDPDERKAAMPFLDSLNGSDFPTKEYSTVAVVNLAATWMPDALLETMLEKKEKELKNTVFVFDKTKHLLKKWQMKDDDSNVLVLDKKMVVLYQKSGTLSAQDQKEIFDLVKKSLTR